MNIQVFIQWTATAKIQLATLPTKTRKGLIKKIGDLRNSDPRKAGKALVGPFLGYRRITHGRYRAMIGIEEEKIVNGDLLLRVTVDVVAVGIRKEHDKNDIYRVALKLFDLGLIPSKDENEAVVIGP